MTHLFTAIFKTGAMGLMLSAPLWAHAHAAHDVTSFSGLLDGLIHPFSGLDHLAAMLAVGLWSATAVRPVWVAPLAFVLMLSIGALLGFAGVQVLAVEPMIAASLLVIGLLMASRQALGWGAAASIAGVFALFHGAAHGAELSGNHAIALLGMVLSTGLLHGVGVLIGRMLFSHQTWLQRSTGAALALLGSALLFGVI